MAEAPLGMEARQFLSQARIGLAVVTALDERDLATADEALQVSLAESADPLLVWAGLMQALRDRDYTWDEWIAQMHDPSSAENEAVTALIDGYEALSEERWEGCQRAAEELIADDPTSAAGYLLMGELMEMVGCMAEAVEAFKTADQLASQDPYASYQLAELYAQLNLFAEAEAAYLRASERSPDPGLRAWLYHSVGNTLQERGQHPEAVEWHKRAVSAGPNDPLLILALAASLLDAQQFDEATVVAEGLMSRPELEGQALILRPQVQVALAAACYNVGTYDRAAALCGLALQPQPNLDPETSGEIETQLHRILEKWSTTSPDALDARLLLGNRLLAMGQTFSALVQVRAAMRLQAEGERETNVDLLNSRVQLAEGNLEGALAAVDTALVRAPAEPYSRYQRALVLCSLDPEEGELAFSRILAAEPGNPIALSDRALIRMGLGRHSEASEDMQAAFIQGDGQWYPLFAPGIPLYGRPFYADLAREARFTLELVPQHIEARTRLAAIHLLVDQKDEAMMTIEAALESPDNLDAWRTAVTIRAALGDGMGAVTAANTVLNRDPKDAFCRYWVWQQEAAEAPEVRALVLDRLEKACEAEPNFWIGWLLMGQLAAEQERGIVAYRYLADRLTDLSAPCILLGEALRYQGRYDEAEVALRQGLGRKERSPRGWRSLGAVLQATGALAEARWAEGWSYFHERRPALAMSSWEAAAEIGWDAEASTTAIARGRQLQQELLGVGTRLVDRPYPY
ncbi:MAG: tetratricopeptide repeat protein [Candidatus Sericytochromatia bacterium]|nr:tetratricopeptide repeat protein [Candidatus Sericytochromatia bacterium]